MKIVILDGYTVNPGDLSWEGIKKFGELTVYDRTPEELIVERVGDAEVVLSSKMALSGEVLSACKNVKYIGLLSTGYNVVDLDYCKENNIVVSNIPAYSTHAVAQFNIALMLELATRIGHHVTQVNNGKWCDSPDFCFWDLPLVELYGKTLGILGFGSIGIQIGKVANALGMKIITPAGRSKKETDYPFELVNMEQFYSQADVISINCPLTDETKKMINKTTLAQMKKTAFIVNTARGPIVDENDLAEALNNGTIAGYASDVVAVEPMERNNPLLNAKNCYITPHIAWAPIETRSRLIDILLDNLASFVAGTPKNNVVK